MICNRIPLTGDDSYLDTYVLDDGEYDRKGRKTVYKRQFY